MRAICCNHKCPRFEHPVVVSDDVSDAEAERCSECGQLLVHESGLTFRDALGDVSEDRPADKPSPDAGRQEGDARASSSASWLDEFYGEAR